MPITAQFTENREEFAGEIPDYKRVSGLAVAGVALGFLTLATFWHSFFAIVAVAAVIVNLLALARISRAAEPLAGRGLAFVGLGMSLVFSGSALTSINLRKFALKKQSREFVAEWFDHMLHGEPHLASIMTRSPGTRPPRDDSLWAFYRQNGEASNGLKTYVSREENRILLAVGQEAIANKTEVLARHYECEGVEFRSNSVSVITDVYAVTFQLKGVKTSYFMRVVTQQIYNLPTDTMEWQIVTAESMGRPPASWRGATP